MDENTKFLHKKAQSIYQKFKTWFKVQAKMAALDNPLLDVTKSKTEDVDTRKYDAYKAVAKAFQEQQAEQMAFKAHESDCDIFSCKKPVCFKREPDKIAQTITEKIDIEVQEKHILKADGTTEKIKVTRRRKNQEK